jgi:hypothetical protein
MLTTIPWGYRTSVIALLILLVAVLQGLHTSPAVHAAQADQQDSVGTFARDVFVIVGSTLRNPTDTTANDARLFNVAGVSLETTWGAWKSAAATSTARELGGARNPRTRVQITLQGLIPGGVYSLFYGTLAPDSENPLCPGVERTLALTSTDRRQSPDASSFVADARGGAEFTAEVDAHLFDALQVFYTVIYHFDGRTYGPLPNRGEYLTQGTSCRSSFGEDAMRQLVIFQKF